MRLLLDSHALLWYISADPKLSSLASNTIGDTHNDVFVSAASLWELSLKYGLGKLTLAAPPAQFFPEQLEANAFQILPVMSIHAYEAGVLRRIPDHRDPFDRLLVAQAKVEDMSLVSADSDLDVYGVSRIW